MNLYTRITGMIEKQDGVLLARSSRTPILDQRCEKSYFQKIGVIFWGPLSLWNRSRTLSSSPNKLQWKRPADSECIDLDETNSSDDFKVKTLDEIQKEKRRHIKENDAVEEGGKNETSEENSKITSPSVFSKKETANSSKQGSSSPGNESEIIYQLSPGLLSLSPSEWIWPRSYQKVVWLKWLSGTVWLA